MGTGSGCLAISIACECSYAGVIATVISALALDVARANAARFAVSDRITFAQGDWLVPVQEPPDLIIANPPYVAQTDRSTLTPEVRAFEPSVALFGGGDGLRDIRTLILQAAECLPGNGGLVMEIGAGQLNAVQQIVAAAGGLRVVTVRKDLRGIPRVMVIGRGSATGGT